jgi:hypothetical protein
MCARTLVDHGLDVTVFEKARGVGGRMATRRTDQGPRFDHGAQYFTVRDERFKRFVDSWIQDGIVAPWEGNICTLTRGQLQSKEKTTPRFVGVPGMNSICRHLGKELHIEFQTQVCPPTLENGLWRITSEDGRQFGEFDYFITSAPAPQSAKLLAAAPGLQQTATATKMDGCWAVMLACKDSLGLPFAGAFVHDSPLSWVARNDTKPKRGSDFENWVLHASPDWTNEHLEADPQQVTPQLVDAFWQATGLTPREPIYAASHRWRYALPPQPIEERCLFEPQSRVGACGDWCSGPRVEGAFLSGASLAGRVLTELATRC